MKYLVPVKLTVLVKMPSTGDSDRDYTYASSLAQTLINKRISQCTWGIGNPCTAVVVGSHVGDPEHDSDGLQSTAIISNDEDGDDYEEY